MAPTLRIGERNQCVDLQVSTARRVKDKRIIIVWFSVFFFAGCLSFGKDVELLGNDFDSKHIDQVSKLTGIQFPEGTRGIAYYYLGSAMDAALAAKLKIPEQKKVEFLENDILKNGQQEVPINQIGKSRKWWMLDSLQGRIDRTRTLPNARYLECSLGKEGDGLVVYISWFET